MLLNGATMPQTRLNSIQVRERCKIKHRKNCECCHHHSLFKGHNVIVHIVVLNCQKCNQCLKCHVSGHKNFQKLWKLPKSLKPFRKSENIQNLLKIVKKNCQNCQKLLKIVKNCQNFSKFFKIFKIVKNCQNVSQVMFPHHCDQMSQRSLVSRVALWCQKTKGGSVSQWVSESVSDKVTYWAVRWQLKMTRCTAR